MTGQTAHAAVTPATGTGLPCPSAARSASDRPGRAACRRVAHPSGAHLAADVADGVAALDAFLAADIVVVGAPMYNFSIPTQLKAWIDRLAIAGRTFRYSATGVEGLAGGKTVII